MLRKYTPDPTHVEDWGELVVNADRTFEEGPVSIMDSQKDCEANEGIMVAPRSGGGNMGTRRHYAC